MIVKPPPKLTGKNSILKYIEVDLWMWIKELSINLSKINFQQNFQAFIVENVLIKAGTQVPITNQFQSSYPGVIPNGRIIIRQTGDANIIDGTTPWNATQLYMMNPSANDATVSILFFR
jgi:hypothetical protein